MTAFIETLVLYCHCGDNVKYGLLSKHLFRIMKQLRGKKNLSEIIRNNKLLSKHCAKATSSSCCVKKVFLISDGAVKLKRSFIAGQTSCSSLKNNIWQMFMLLQELVLKITFRES